MQSVLIINDEGKVIAIVMRSVYMGENKYGDSRYFRWTIRVPKGVTLDEVKRGLHQALDQHCTHSYDCCGHWYRSVYTHDMRHTKRREYHINVVYSQNV